MSALIYLSALLILYCTTRPIAEDDEAAAGIYNSELLILSEEKRNTWFTAPWLFAE